MPVVVLVDEYDKPMLDNIETPEITFEMREGLKNLYSVLKKMDEHLHFVFLTGMSKFSKVNIFSGVNNLNDAVGLMLRDGLNYATQVGQSAENTLGNQAVIAYGKIGADDEKTTFTDNETGEVSAVEEAIAGTDYCEEKTDSVYLNWSEFFARIVGHGRDMEKEISFSMAPQVISPVEIAGPGHSPL